MTPLEICVETVAGAALAAECGADRIELCAGLIEGGTTPSARLLARVCADVGIPVVALIRPRAGDFAYSSAEVDVMRRDIDVAREAGAFGVALGALRADATIDLDATADLVAHARPLAVTFHRAFDAVRDQLTALDALVGLGVDRILTSGAAARAIDGAPRLAELVARSGGGTTILAAGSVRSGHVRELIATTGVTEIHSSARVDGHGPLADECARLVAACRG